MTANKPLSLWNVETELALPPRPAVPSIHATYLNPDVMKVSVLPTMELGSVQTTNVKSILPITGLESVQTTDMRSIPPIMELGSVQTSNLRGTWAGVLPTDVNSILPIMDMKLGYLVGRVGDESIVQVGFICSLSFLEKMFAWSRAKPRRAF